MKKPLLMALTFLLLAAFAGPAMAGEKVTGTLQQDTEDVS
jgi:hypothetical protein